MKNFTTTKEAIDWIHSRLKFGSRPGLLRVEALLKKVGNPEIGQHFIHVAGTNGKGSTTRFLGDLLQEVGLKVGSFTSPYIETFNERIQINDIFISNEELLELVNQVAPFVEELDQDPQLAGITEFEINTVISFLYFKDKVDVAVMEVGLGGLQDSTNVITPEISAITTIGLDHIEILGDTLEKIAFQKAGIIKPQIPVVTGNIPKEAMEVIETVSQEKQSPLFQYQKDYQVTFKKDLPFGEAFDYDFKDFHFKDLKISLMGRHQVENAGLSLTLFLLYCEKLGLHFEEKDIKNSLQKTFWPARLEVLNEKPLILLDGAHNLHAVKRLVENVQTRFKGKKIWFLYSAIKTKDIDDMLQELKKIKNNTLILTTFEHPKALSFSELQSYQELGYEAIPIWQDALLSVTQKMDEADIFIITGSLYFSSQVRELFKGQTDEV